MVVSSELLVLFLIRLGTFSFVELIGFGFWICRGFFQTLNWSEYLNLVVGMQT